MRYTMYSCGGDGSAAMLPWWCVVPLWWDWVELLLQYLTWAQREKWSRCCSGSLQRLDNGLETLDEIRLESMVQRYMAEKTYVNPKFKTKECSVDCRVSLNDNKGLVINFSIARFLANICPNSCQKKLD